MKTGHFESKRLTRSASLNEYSLESTIICVAFPGKSVPQLPESFE